MSGLSTVCHFTTKIFSLRINRFFGNQGDASSMDSAISLFHYVFIAVVKAPGSIFCENLHPQKASLLALTNGAYNNVQ